MVSKIIIVIASLFSLTLIVGLSMNISTSSDSDMQSNIENMPPASYEFVDSSINEKLKDVGLSANQYEAIKTVQEYQGTDKEGRTVEELTTYVTESLLVEEIKKYPSTNFGWTGYPNDLEGDGSIYKVIYNMQTDEQKFEVIYNINLETNEIWGENYLAKDILILADIPDSSSNSRI